MSRWPPRAVGKSKGQKCARRRGEEATPGGKVHGAEAGRPPGGEKSEARDTPRGWRDLAERRDTRVRNV